MMGFLDKQELLHTKIANVVSVFAFAGFMVLRTYDLIVERNSDKLPNHFIIGGLIALFMVISLILIKESARLGFCIPALFIIGVMTGVIFVGGTPLIFIILVGILGISGIYFNSRYFLHLVLLEDFLLFIVIVIMGLPILSESVNHSDVVFQWIMLQFCALVIYVTVRHATNRDSISVAAKESFDAMLASTPNIVALVDDLNCITYISKPLADFAHLERPDLTVGRPLIDLFNDSAMINMITDVLNSSGDYQNTVEVTRESEVFFYKIISKKLYGSSKGRLIDITDVTPIMKARYEAEKATRVKSEFLATMSHEIRTPMNAIIGMSELTMREDISKAAREHIFTIRQAGSNLLSIINDILDFSKIESGKLEIVSRKYSFSSLINDVVNIIRMKVIDTRLQFVVRTDCNIPNVLLGDEKKVRQILLNVLSNAVKYTDEGYVSFIVNGEMGSDDNFTFSMEVADSGRGIKPEDMGKLFDTFVQFDSASNKGIEGTGLGLAITHSLVKAMGGEITVSSEYGRGSTFTVVLPQKVYKYEKLTTVKNPDEKRSLVFGRLKIYADSIVYAIGNLGVECRLVFSEDEFREEMKKGLYPFVFVASSLYEKARAICGELKAEPKIVLLCRFGEVIADPHLSVLVMPVYSIPVANILNGVIDTSYSTNKEIIARFTATDARVLVVDDITTNLKVAEGLLLPYKLQIDLRKSGAEAIAAVKAKYYDLIFMDHKMPVMDGMQTTGFIRAMGDEDPYYRDVPIVALTANAVSGMSEMFLKNGFNDYLSKPIDTVMLDSILQKWIPKEKRDSITQNNNNKISAVNEQKNIFSGEIAGLDVKEGVSHSGGTPEIYTEVLTIFCEDIQEKIPQITNCLETGNVPLYTIYVHAIKSACANIGAGKLSKDARELEAAGNSNNTAYLEAHTAEFLADLKKLVNDIHLSLPAKKEKIDNGQPAMDTNVFRAELSTLKTAIDKMDFTAIDNAIKKLENTALDNDMSSAIHTISDCILMCDYDEAAKSIDKLLQEGRSK